MSLKSSLRAYLYAGRRLLRRKLHPVRDFSALRRVTPISSDFGLDRGQPVDRYYIENFLERHRGDIHGRTLEVLSSAYTRRFGGRAVGRSDVLHPVSGNPDATIVGNLATGDGIPSEAFDCIICTQTLHLIYEIDAAVASLHRALKPGGVVLATLPGISQISRYDFERWGDYWRFTSLAVRRLFSPLFEDVRIEAHGNVLAAISFLHGVTSEELTRAELDHVDPDYEVTICVRARR